MRGDPLDFLQSYAMRGWFVFKISCTWSIIVGPIKSVFSLSLLSVVAFRSVSLIQILESTRRELLNFPDDTFSNLSKLLLFFHSPPFFPSRTRFSRTSFITLAIYPKPVLHIRGRIISPRFAPLINATFLILWKKKLPIFTMAFRHRACPNESRWSEPVDLVIDSKFFSISCRGNRTVSVEQSC